MSLPVFPIDPSSLTREDAINQILLSIAMEEMGLSHIINAEGEKIQYALGTLDGISGPGASVEEVLKVNESVKETLTQAANLQHALVNKLKTAVSAPVLRGPTGPTGPTEPSGDTKFQMTPLAVSEYMALPDNEKHSPTILWVIYPDGFLEP